jgi:chorismate mutase
MTVEFLLQDCPGVLSCVLSAFAKAGANILTVNQTSPESGAATATVCARTDAMSTPIDLFIEQLGRIPGVQHLRLTRT